MKVLAIELSTDVGSLSLLHDGEPSVELSWCGDRLGRDRLFADIHGLVEAGKLDLASLDLVAVGVGPGSFSGLRMAVSMAFGLAMPDRTPVFAVSSAEALAWDVFNDTGDVQVCVTGDARRGEIWIGRFRVDGGLPNMVEEWKVASFDSPEGSLGGGGAAWVTPDWDRIGPRLSKMIPPDDRLLTGRRVPQARSLGALALRKRDAGLSSLPLSPLYVHPPVAAVRNE